MNNNKNHLLSYLFVIIFQKKKKTNDRKPKEEKMKTKQEKRLCWKLKQNNDNKMTNNWITTIIGNSRQEREGGEPHHRPIRLAGSTRCQSLKSLSQPICHFVRDRQ